jgi:cell division protein FtsI (penicillin-binding protein 3)
MSKFDYKKVMPRYSAIAIVLTLISVAVVGKALYTMTVKHDYWMTVASRLKKDSVSVKPVRGNILSCDGQLMASSLPEFRIYMDFKALHDAKNDSLWRVKLDSISKGLNQIFPNKSAAQFKKDLEIGRKQQSRHWPIWERRIDYSIFSEVKRLPVLKLTSYRGGFHVEEFNARQRPFGSAAGRTIGTLFGAKDSARFGLELSYDSILRGTNGIIHRRKVLNKFLDIMDTPPIDGADIVTTIDVNMQDLAERSVVLTN